MNFHFCRVYFQEATMQEENDFHEWNILPSHWALNLMWKGELLTAFLSFARHTLGLHFAVTWLFTGGGGRGERWKWAAAAIERKLFAPFINVNAFTSTRAAFLLVGCFIFALHFRVAFTRKIYVGFGDETSFPFFALLLHRSPNMIEIFYYCAEKFSRQSFKPIETLWVETVN